ncbi:MAG: LuxR C-terminal-related transcriptional regulator [Solirubrobacteraceae bacterium]
MAVDRLHRDRPFSGCERETVGDLACWDRVAHLTNRQIAERLVLSPKTIERHMEHICAKLRVTLRGAVARIVLRQHAGR